MADSTETVLQRHLEAFGKLDEDGMLADYTNASVFILTDGTVLRGPDQIRSLVKKFFAEFGKPGMSFEMGVTRIEGEVAYINWKAETADNIYEMGSDTFVIRDGKIASQTMAAKLTPKS